MKKIIVVIATLLVCNIMCMAQSDSTRTNTKQLKNTSRDADWYKHYPTSDMVKMKSSDIPSPLRTTLQSKEYSGWENGTIYQNPQTSEWSLRLTQPANTAVSTQTGGWYRFDAQGKRIPEKPKE